MWRSVVLAVLVAWIPNSSEFLFNRCEAPVGCACALPVVDCSSKRLPRIPEFNMTSHKNMLYLYLQKNHILVVPQDAFDGINTDKLYLDLSNNYLRDIHPNAFDSLKNNITFLKLENNMLTTLPTAVANLTKLTYLDIHGNPIATFDHSVLEPLGNHLEILYVGSGAMKNWPPQFQFLRRLNALHVLGAAFDNIPDHAFKSFASTLVNLEIGGTNLTSVPYAFCDLTRIKNFYFDDNQNLNDDDILPHCDSPATSVSAVSLDNNHMSIFPLSIFYLFPNLKTLSISSNQHLDSMAGVYVPTPTLLTSLTMGGNNFSRIPNEMGDLTSLRILDFHANSLTEVLNNDFEHLTHLSRLILSDNPLNLIEDNSFSNESSLFHLSLDNTKLPTIPLALLDLENLHTLDYKGNDLDCTCTDLRWLASWKPLSSLHVTGECGNTNTHLNEPVQTFLQIELQRCP